MNRKKDIISCLEFVWRYDHILIIELVIVSIIIAVNPYIAILISAYTLDSITAGMAFTKIFPVIGFGLFIVFLLYLLSSYLKHARDTRIEYCGNRFDLEVGIKSQTLDYEQLENPDLMELRTRIANDRNWGVGFYSVYWQLDALLSAAFELIAAIVILAPLFASSSHGGLLGLFSTGLMVITICASLLRTHFADRRVHKLMNESMDAVRYFSHFIFSGNVDSHMGKDIRLYEADKLICEYIENEFHGLIIPTSKRFSLYSGLGALISGLSAGLVQGFAYLIVVWQALTVGLPIGSVIKYSYSIYRFSKALLNLLNALGSFNVTAQRQQSTLAYLEVQTQPQKGMLPVDSSQVDGNTIEFRNVSYRYPGNEQCAIENFSMDMRMGGSTAIVGINGSGKTTLIKLLTRLCTPTQGKILFNGTNILEYNCKEYFSLFSVVFQDFKLFAFSLGQNVAASIQMDDTRARDALEKSGLPSWPLDTMLYKCNNEYGVEISGGEAQKIALARAVYKNAPIFILDEPTAALDPVAEYEIYKQLHVILKNRTAIFISHRLSSCRFCDNIIVLDAGYLVQQGSHDELLGDTDGQYYKLWRAQAQYYK